jgi:hypothetical protein
MENGKCAKSGIFLKKAILLHFQFTNFTLWIDQAGGKEIVLDKRLNLL